MVLRNPEVGGRVLIFYKLIHIRRRKKTVSLKGESMPFTLVNTKKKDDGGHCKEAEKRPVKTTRLV